MIIKSFEDQKIDLTKQKIHLLYGENQGYIADFVENIFKKKFKDNVYQYEESEILKNQEILFEHLQTLSFFEKEKLILINRVTEKIRDIIEQISENEIDDIHIVLISTVLEKKSKLRVFFEKSKKFVCIPFYKDNDQTLINLVTTFFREKKISVSQQVINLIIRKSMNDRRNLKNELHKIEVYALNKKRITEEEILKLINLSENHQFSSLIDNCLIKNEKKIKEILNESNFTSEESIQIIRVFLFKSKKLLEISNKVNETKNIETALTQYKPSIFWKDKPIVKEQLKIWPAKKIKNLILRINSTELLIKKNYSNSINILLDFILKETLAKTNN